MLKNKKKLTLLWIKNKHAHAPHTSFLDSYVLQTVDTPYQTPQAIHETPPHFIIIHIPIKDLSEPQLVQLIRHTHGAQKTPIIAIQSDEAETLLLRGLRDPHLHIIPHTPEALKQFLDNNAPAEDPAASKVYKAGEIEVDTIKYEIKIKDKFKELTPTEFKLLKVLLERKGRVQTREHLLSSVWNYASEIESRTIDTHIRRLREKLGKEGQIIQTVRGIGYKIPENI